MKRRSKIRIMLRDIKIGLKNLVIWFPIIYKDKNWDYQYFYEIVHHKLSLMESRYRNGQSYIQEDLRVANEIKEVLDLLDKVIQDRDYDNRHPMQRRLDTEKAFEIIGEKSLGWWD